MYSTVPYTYSEKLPHFVEDVSEDEPFLVSVEPSVFGDTGYQLTTVRREVG